MGQPERTVRSDVEGTQEPQTRSDSVQPEGQAAGPTWRRRAFRVVAVLTSLWVLAVMIFGLTEIVLMWLPAGTLSSVGDTLDLGEIDLAHRAHYMSIGVVGWTLVLGVLVQVRRPARREAPMLHVLALAIGLAVTAALSGSPRAWLTDMLVIVVPLLLLGILHPHARQLVRMPTWDGGMIALAALGVLPWGTFAVINAQQQWRAVAGDTHAEMDHWATVALMALLILACSFIGATDRSGWRLTAWIAALASMNYGLHSLVYPEPASAASTSWAIAALVWGLAYAASTIRRSRLAPPGA